MCEVLMKEVICNDSNLVVLISDLRGFVLLGVFVEKFLEWLVEIGIVE